MPFLYQDLFGLALGTLLAPLLMLLPGLGLVRFAMRDERGWQGVGWAMLLAFALLSVVDTLVLRISGMAGLVGLHAGIALYGLPLLRSLSWRGTLPFLALALSWWLICAWSFVDFDEGGRLHQSLIVYDLVKHAAVTEQIAREGVPFHDPFFARDGFAGYYHYYYGWPAAVRWSSGFAISARMAFAACVFWTGIAVPALLWRMAADAGLVPAGRGRPMLLVAVLLCLATGADLIMILLRRAATGLADPQIDMWNSEVAWMLRSTLWVPHHLVAVMAGWTGMLLAQRAMDEPGDRALAVGAGFAFASMFGLSAWVAMTLVPLLAGWGIMRLWLRDTTLLIAGTVAILLSLPQMFDLLQGRASEGFPIGLGVRSFMQLLPEGPLSSQLVYLALLPLNYALEFGVFALGAVMAWRMRPEGPARGLLLWSALVSLSIASSVQSVLINNDLGWRSILFAQMAAMVATMHVLAHRANLSRRQKGWIGGLLLIGLAGTAYDIAGLRLIRPSIMAARPIPPNRDPAIDHALRTAYDWADAHLPRGVVLQHDPAQARRAFDFGLYGHHWPAVADSEAHLFGAGKQAVAERIALLTPIFAERLSRDESVARAGAARADYLLFTARDKIWPTLPLRCAYRTLLVCIAPVGEKARP